MIKQMKDSGVKWLGEVPVDWDIKNIGNYLNQVKNKNNELLERNLLSLSYGKIIRRNINTTEGLLPENFSSYNIVQENDIVLRMTDLQNDKKSLRTGLVTEKGIITSAYITLRCKSNVLNLINANFVHYQLYAFDIIKGFYGMGSGVRQNINFDDIKTINITLPSFKKQQQVVDFLDNSLEKIETIIFDTRKSIEELKKYKQSLITEVVTKGLDKNIELKDSGVEWIGNIPRHWGVTKLKNITKKIGDVDHRMPESQDTGYPYVSPLDFKGENEIDFENAKKISEEDYLSLSKKIKPQVGDIIFARYATIGTLRLVKEDVLFLPSYSCLILKFNEKVIPKYTYYYLKSSTILHEVEYRKKSNTQSNVGLEDLKMFNVILPSLEDQIEIVNYLDEKTNAINNLISDKEKMIVELEQYKKSLIYEYVTGKKQV